MPEELYAFIGHPSRNRMLTLRVDGYTGDRLMATVTECNQRRDNHRIGTAYSIATATVKTADNGTRYTTVTA